LAGGNVAVALFNTIISNLAGVVLTPVLINLFMNARTSSDFESLGGLIQTIALLILLPFVIGQICRWLIGGDYVNLWKKPVDLISRAIVLFIVFNTFSDSMIKGVWDGQGLQLTVSVLSGVIVFAVIVLLVVALGNRWMRLAPPEGAALCFLASHKTLAAGVPMAKLIFLGRSDLALILLPIMFYHPLQLIVSGLLVTRFKLVSEKLK
jgi:sodium/bile acid cotransporter 7